MAYSKQIMTPTMADYQVAIVMAIKRDPGHVFKGCQERAAQRMIRLGWLADVGDGRFTVLPKGEIAFRQTGNMDEGKIFKIRFVKSINLEVRKGNPPKREWWRFGESHEMWVARTVPQEHSHGGASSLFYTLHSLDKDECIVDVPASAFQLIEAKRTVE